MRIQRDLLIGIGLLCLLLITGRAQQQQPDIEMDAINNAADTEGGKRFERVIGIRGALSVLSDSLNFIPSLFNYGSGAPRKNVTRITFTVEKLVDAKAITYMSGVSEYKIKLRASSVDNSFEGVKGVMFHELTHVWQYFGRGTPSGVIEGVADYVRLKAGLVPSHWVKPGGGERWDQGNDVTAYFLDYCNSLNPDFVWKLNAALANNGQWRESIFSRLLGKGVQQIWIDYKKKYGA